MSLRLSVRLSMNERSTIFLMQNALCMLASCLCRRIGCHPALECACLRHHGYQDCHRNTRKLLLSVKHQSGTKVNETQGTFLDQRSENFILIGVLLLECLLWCFHGSFCPWVWMKGAVSHSPNATLWAKEAKYDCSSRLHLSFTLMWGDMRWVLLLFGFVVRVNGFLSVGMLGRIKEGERWQWR